MAIAKMKKLSLAAMSYEKDGILNALQRTGATEITMHGEVENTVVPDVCDGELKEKLSAAEAALSVLSVEIDAYNKENKIKSSVLKDGFDVDYSDFMSACDRAGEAEEWIVRVGKLADEKNALTAELIRLKKRMDAAKLYRGTDVPLSLFSDTAHTRTRLGTVELPAKETLDNALKDNPLIACSVLRTETDGALFEITWHKCEDVDPILTAAGFVPCPFSEEEKQLSGKQLYENLVAQWQKINRDLKANAYAMYEMNDKIRPLKIYCDYLAYALEKEEVSDKLRATERTFLLEAYVPETAEEAVKSAVQTVTGAAYFEFSAPAEDEEPPTLMENNGVIRNFESVTNMYAAPKYRELDPNTVMAFFYSLFLGFIMGDVGYGLLMIVGGGIIYYRTRARDGGLRRMAAVFAIGGIFAVVWGVLFNSLFGMKMSFLPTLMPDAQNDMWTFAGIGVPAVLVISLLMGIFQLGAGYVCRVVQLWRRGDVVGALCDGGTWALFSVGAFIAVIGFVEEAQLSSFAMIGALIAGAGLLAAMLTAGRKEKILGKFSKGFGAAYNIINYASDVLSYARLYGLMLSGAVIASIVSEYAVGFITGGNPIVAVLGVALMVVGHLFNLAMSLLSAYIHDARLQYVEFYGKFFEGDGELFTPLGSQHKYIYLLPASASEEKARS